MNNSIARIAKPSKLTETIAERLRAMIADGVLKPGDKLPTEKELCDGFGVGRSSVREALGMLEHAGLIQSRPGVGRFLTPEANSLLGSLGWGQMIERASLVDLMEARKCLEVTVARLAAERATDEIIASLESCLKAMEACGGKDIDQFFENELDFHLSLSKACQNSVLTELVNTLIHRISGQAERFLRTLPYTFQATIDQFSRILKALKDGDPELAGASMEEHLDIVRDVLNRGSGEGNKAR